MREQGRVAGWAVIAVLACAPGITRNAGAQPAGNAAAEPELYQHERIARALREEGLQRDPAPGGKRIGFVRIHREDVFVDGDLVLPLVLPRFAPTWPNVFHWLTHKRVIRRELLLAEGQRYDPERAEETARNLRSLGIFALVDVIAVRTAQPDTVGVLVYTRDLWSLRAETGFRGTADAFDLSARFVERNLFGRNKQLSASFRIDPKSFSVGQGYEDLRLLGSDLALVQSFRVIFNKGSQDTEGSAARVSVGRPFYDLAQRWSWSASASYLVFVNRTLRGAEVVGFDPDDGSGEPCDPAQAGCLRAVWDDRSYSLATSVTYRRGERYKQSFTLGAGASDRDVEANGETDLPAGEREAFRRGILPRVRRQVFPRVGYGLSLPDYVTFENLGTFGQSENVRVGPSASFGVRLPLEAFGSSTNSVVFDGGMGYILADGRGLLELSVEARARLEEGEVVDQRLKAELRGATPPWMWGRIVGRGSWLGRRNDTSQTPVVLGGDSGLRGFGSGAFQVNGGSMLRGNLEYRTLPLDVYSLHVGAVAFYDAGSVYSRLADAEFHHGAGLGLRLLFPQFNRYVFRFDAGVPLDEPGFAVRLSYGTAQMVPLTTAEDELL